MQWGLQTLLGQIGSIFFIPLKIVSWDGKENLSWIKKVVSLLSVSSHLSYNGVKEWAIL